MKKTLFIILFITANLGFSQSEDNRIQTIKNHLDVLAVDNPGLTEQVKSEINVSNITLSNFLLALSEMHNININLSPEINGLTIANNFTNVSVSDLLVFLCKEYHLTIDFTGNILSIKKYVEPTKEPEKRVIPITYDPDNNTISIDAKNDKLYDVFKGIMDQTGKNLVFTPGLENKSLTSYIKQMSFDTAMENLAISNNLYANKTKDNFYVFEDITNENPNRQNINRRKSVGINILDLDQKLLEVNFFNTPIKAIIDEIANELNLNIFTATPLDKAGNITFKTNSISLDDLLTKIFESDSNSQNENLAQQNPNNTRTDNAQFTFKKEGNTYFFGTKDQLSVRSAEIIHLQHRSIQILTDPSGGTSRTVGRTYNNRNSYGTSVYPSSNYGSYNNSYNNTLGSSTTSINRNMNTRESINLASSQNNFNNSETKVEALLNVLPEDLKQDLDIKIDYELNSFYVLGPSAKIERFKNFIKKIDRPVPVILIEVMLIEVSRSATVEAGVGWGIGEEATNTQGNIFPETDLTLGAKTINRVLNGFDGFGHINLGKVVPNFFATIKAMEENGNIKIRSTPKLSTLNGHRATFSNGQTSYYTVTQRNIYGTDNPQTSEITNYEPIDAELGLTIKPLVSGDGQVTLDIFVIQSSFGVRVAEDAPPDLSSREFSSIIRVQDQDIVVLGGLEEQVKNDSGSGVPLLARVPVIKWLFSKRKREDSKAKLTVLIKPTVIY